jgi:hypothetical protein
MSNTGMVINQTIKFRWCLAILQLVVLSLGLIFLFAIIYWGMSSLNWGILQGQAGNRAVGFLPFLYFSAETFFCIGYGTQIPFGAMWVVVTLEALSHFIIEILFIAHFTILSLGKLVPLNDRDRLENLMHRF